MQRERTPVCAQAGHLTTDSDDFRAARSQISRQVVVVLVAIRRRHQHRDIASNDISLSMSKETFCAWIEFFDAAVRIDDDDGVYCRLDDRTPSQFVGPGLGHGRACLR